MTDRKPHAPNGNRLRTIELLQKGLSHKQVAARTGLAMGTISSYAAWGRDQGLLQSRSRDRLRPEYLVEGLPVHVARWLRKDTPPGATVIDTIRSILIDAYNEEHPDAE